MCTTDIFTDVYPDGRKHEYQRPKPCDHALRHGQPCAHPSVFRHPPTSVGFGEASTPFLHPNQAPPTPRQTPRAATPVVYGSGNESDRSRRSGSSDKRSSGIYVNGQKVLDLNRKRQPRNERIVIVDAPPTPRTPPRQFAMPHTAPPSPNAANIPHFQYNVVDAHSPRESSRRPVIVDERPRPSVQIEVIDSNNNTTSHHRHRRHLSNESRNSHSSSALSDEERRRRRHEARERDREDRQRAEEELRRQKQRARIAAANEAIKRRPAIPIPPAPPAPVPKIPRASTMYTRPNVEFAVPVTDRERERELVEAVRRLKIEEQMLADAQRRERKQEKEEEEAQRRRLMERMMPRRRATVGPGARRHRVLYDDGVYRWE